jgi:hypothetical protein
MWVSFFVAVLLLGSCSGVAMAADAKTLRIPVHVWFGYGGSRPIPCANEADVAAAVVDELMKSVKPYLFVKESTESSSHLRIELSRERSLNMSLKADLFGYSKSGGPSNISVVQGPFEMGKASYGEGSPNCSEWPARVANIIALPSALNKLKHDLHADMPFAKGVKVLNPPPPHNAREAWLQILTPLDREFANHGHFDVEYEEGAKVGAEGVACTPENLIIVEPNWETVTKKGIDYDRLKQDSGNKLIYLFDDPPLSATIGCKPYAQPPPKQMPRSEGQPQ